MPPLEVFLVSAAFLLVLFFLTWWLSVRLNNYSWVDGAWALAFAPVAVWYAVSGQGWLPRRIVLASLIAAWSLRLGVHLCIRIASHHPREDARYAVLRKRWQPGLRTAFFWFFQAQGLLVWLLLLPAWLIMQEARPAFHPAEYAGLLIWITGLLGEALADHQLKRFKAANRDPKAICQTGLWRYSRHPNYFFQSLLWWGVFVMALPAPWGWATVAAPLAMLHFLLNVTGVPLTEKLALEKRGDAYREYQRTTSAFIPWFRKS